MRARVARAWTFASAGFALGTPWVLLGARVWLAAVFLALDAAMAMSGQILAAPIHAGWWAGEVAQIARSGPGAAVAILCPALLAAGVAGRPSAAAMLLQVAMFRMQGDTLNVQLCRAGLLLVIVVLGPGPLSVDALLSRGLQRAAIPGGLAVQRIYRAITALGTPALLLMLRLAFALLLLTPEAALLRPKEPLAAMRLPSMPGLLGAMPEVLAIVSAALLTTGLGVRPTALFLLLLVPLPHASDSVAVTELSVYVVLLLALLACCGGGTIAVDRALSVWLMRKGADSDLALLPHVVIVGGGFGGAAAAAGLAGAPCRVTLIDRRNYHLFQPLLYQVATAGLSPADIATPIRQMFRYHPGLRVRLAEVTGVDAARQAVLLGADRVPFDYLVLATGARHSYFGHDEWSGLAPGLKSIEDATAIRGRLLRAFETAEAEPDIAARGAWLTFVIIGGGPTGVELAGAIAELARFGMAGEFRDIDPATARVLLVQSGDRVLPSFPPDLSRRASDALKRLGVEILTGTAAESIESGGVLVGGQFVAARTVLWAAGVMASPAAAWLGTPADRAGRVLVDSHLTASGSPNIFVIGDTAASNGWKGQPVPGLAPAAKQGGSYVAREIRARLAGKKSRPFRYRHYGSLATIGRKAAVADFGRVRVSGAPAWWLWGGAHILFLVGGRNRVAVAAEWLWDYLTFRRSVRLITDRTEL